MEHKVLRTAEKLQKSHTKKHWLYRGLSVLAAGAVFCTTYALILPAITLDKDAICGYDEHTHTDECYTSTGAWACMDNADTYEMLANADYVAHTHTDECYNESGEMICPFADWDNLVEPHEHTDECYQIVVHTHNENCMKMVEGELICTLDESDGHTHDEGCMGEEPVLICELPEHEFHTDDCYGSDGNIICGLEKHVHGDECYETELVNVCEIEEGEGRHTHTSTCYEYVTKPTCNIDEGTETAVLICGKVALHSHTDACYTDGALTCGQPEVILHQHENCYVPSEPVLTCEIEEHTHTDECYGTYEEVPGMYNSAADSSGEVGENALEWYAKLPAEYTGNWATDLAAVAKSQVGYKEEADPTEEEPDRTYNIYSAYLETIYDDFVRSEASWDQIFVTWCLTVSDIEATEIPQPYTVEEFWEQAEYQGMLRMDEYTAGTGDIVILLKDDGNFRSGIVDCVDEDGIHVVLGDEDCAVVEQTVTSNDVIAWVSVQYQYNVHHPEQDAGDEITDVESYYNWQAMQDLAASGWFTYWADHPTLYEEETTVVQTTPPAEGEDTSPSSVQIDEKGGAETSADGRVDVSKTIAGTDTENVFDITLTVTTDQMLQKIQEDPDIAVVVVMDISNTMTEEVDERYETDENGSTELKEVSKYQMAVEAAEAFADTFAEYTRGVSTIGFVAFNTDAHEICSMTDVSTTQKLNDFKNNLRENTKNIIYAENYGSMHSRFTNMEAGLQMAHDMLKETSNQNKFIVFLTDGLPTTYSKSGYTGYDPYMDTGNNANIYGYGPDSSKLGQDGYFADMTKSSGQWCYYGTSYSDRAAQKASTIASTIKSEKITIYSVGVSLKFEIKFNEDSGFEEYNGTYTPYEYVKTFNEVDAKRYFAVIDRGDVTIDNLEVFKINKAFEGENGWLGQVIATPGYYYAADNIAQMNSAFDNIFKDLAAKTNAYSTDAWVVTDPIPVGADLGYVEYVAPLPVEKIDADGNNVEGNYITNKYEYLTDEKTISWDLLKSDYWYTTTETDGGTTVTKYVYKLKYRVRLANEEDKFVEKKIYETNGKTTLRYQVIETENNKTTMSDIRTVDFPIPSVHGYLGDLTFTKVDNYGTAVVGAGFTLVHDENCKLCTLTEENQTYWSSISSMNRTTEVVSGEDGKVSFTGIPSGHTYILTETKVPDGYHKAHEQYYVDVAYDVVTVYTKENDKEHSEVEKKNDLYAIPNYTSVELPATGGTGTKRYILMGVLLMSTAVLLYTVRRRQRE